jgi:hypothetical protein
MYIVMYAVRRTWRHYHKDMGTSGIPLMYPLNPVIIVIIVIIFLRIAEKSTNLFLEFTCINIHMCVRACFVIVLQFDITNVESKDPC